MTTSLTAKDVPFRDNRLLHFLCPLFLIVWIVSAINPVMFADWVAENVLVVCFIGLLILGYRWMPFSDLSYLLIFAYLCLHEWGAHHMYANVPLGEWMKPWLHTSRNHYDRIVHFSFGLLLAYPEREILLRKLRLTGLWALAFPVIFALGLGAAFEIIEAIAAVSLRPDLGDAYISLQGDPWDTHKDMFMGFAGAVVTMTIVGIYTYRKGNRAARLAGQAGA
jgi:putative membrane protein